MEDTNSTGIFKFAIYFFTKEFAIESYLLTLDEKHFVHFISSSRN